MSTSSTSKRSPETTSVRPRPEEDSSPATKRSKTTDDEDDIWKFIDKDRNIHRGWSKTITDEDSEPSKIYTFKCTFCPLGPVDDLPSFVKCASKARLQDALRCRRLSTKGTKKELLHRLQTDNPYVILEIDARESFQRLVVSFLHYFGWGNEHLYECQVPRAAGRSSRCLYGPASSWNSGESPTLESLGLQSAEELKLTYDFGENHAFKICLLNAEEESYTLPEMRVNRDLTRVVEVMQSETAIMRDEYFHDPADYPSDDEDHVNLWGPFVDQPYEEIRTKKEMAEKTRREAQKSERRGDTRPMIKRIEREIEEEKMRAGKGAENGQKQEKKKKEWYTEEDIREFWEEAKDELGNNFDKYKVNLSNQLQRILNSGKYRRGMKLIDRIF